MTQPPGTILDMNAITVWLGPALVAVALVCFVAGGIMISASRNRAVSRGFTVLWVAVGALVAAAAVYVVPLIALSLGARPA